MAQWRKVIVSASCADLNQLSVDTGVTASIVSASCFIGVSSSICNITAGTITATNIQNAGGGLTGSFTGSFKGAGTFHQISSDSGVYTGSFSGDGSNLTGAGKLFVDDTVDTVYHSGSGVPNTGTNFMCKSVILGVNAAASGSCLAPYSVMIGASAGENVATTTSGGSFTWVGGEVGQGHSGSAAFTVAIGRRSLWCANQGVSNGVFIGYNVACGLTGNGTNSTVVGANSFLRSNVYGAIVIGNSSAVDQIGCYNITLGFNSAKSLIGEDNINIGRASGDIAQSEEAIAIGTFAGCSLIGTGSISIGSCANRLGVNEAGIPNLALGFRALQCNVSGSGLIAIGTRAMCLTGGTSPAVCNNIAIGTEALKSGATSHENVAIGHCSYTSTTNGCFGVVIGNNAGAALGTASDTTLIGYNAGCLLGNNVFRNTYVGSCAAISSSGGNDNVGIGFQALCSVTNASCNSALGSSAGRYLTTGDFNVSVGYLNGPSGSAENSIMIGRAAGQLADGCTNIGIGHNAMLQKNNAAYSIAIGYSAFAGAGSTTTSSSIHSIYIGTCAGYRNCFDESTVYIGNQAGCGHAAGGCIVTGSVGIGCHALKCGVGSFNVGIGYCAGPVSTGNDNIFIGCLAGRNQTSGTGNIMIGKEAGCDVTTGLGNVFLGGYSGSASVNCGIFFSDGLGNVRSCYNQTDDAWDFQGSTICNFVQGAQNPVEACGSTTPTFRGIYADSGSGAFQIGRMEFCTNTTGSVQRLAGCMVVCGQNYTSPVQPRHCLKIFLQDRGDFPIEVMELDQDGGAVRFFNNTVAPSGACTARSVQLNNDCFALSNNTTSCFRVENCSRSAWIGLYKNTSCSNNAGAIYIQSQDAGANYIWSDDSSQLRISATQTNIATTGGTVVGTQTSDIRLKVTQSFDYGLQDLLQLNPIKFCFCERMDEARLGFAAQEIQQVIPETVYDTNECVTVDGCVIASGSKLALYHQDVIPVTVKAIQELYQCIQNLQVEIDCLKCC